MMKINNRALLKKTSEKTRGLKENKRAQIGNTLTWFTSTIIIFFIMVLFLTTAILSSGTKKVTSGWDEVKLTKSELSLRSQRVLLQLLESKISIENQTLKLKDWLKEDLYNMEESKKGVLRELIKSKVLESVEANKINECYAFQAVSGIKDPEVVLNNVDLRGQGYVANFISKSSIEFGNYYNPNVDPRGMGYISEAHKKLLKRATSIVLIRDTRKNVFGVEEDYQKVNVRFYIGAC